MSDFGGRINHNHAAAAAVCAHFLVSVDFYVRLGHVLHLNTRDNTSSTAAKDQTEGKGP